MGTETRRMFRIDCEDWVAEPVGEHPSASGFGAGPVNGPLPEVQHHVHFRCWTKGDPQKVYQISVQGESADGITDEEIAQAIREELEEEKE